jgi:hypothetical protein
VAPCGFGVRNITDIGFVGGIHLHYADLCTKRQNPECMRRNFEIPASPRTSHFSYSPSSDGLSFNLVVI